jgi:hypothetical protein
MLNTESVERTGPGDAFFSVLSDQRTDRAGTRYVPLETTLKNEILNYSPARSYPR